jgi:hypothetical protein
MCRRIRILGVAIGVSLFLMVKPVLADPAPVLSDQEIDARLNFVTEQLQSEQTSAEYWEYGWGAFNGGSMVWSAVQASQDQGHKNHDTDIVQAVEGLAGVADVVFRPLPAFSASTVCDQKINTEEDRLQCLAAKEDLLERSAERAQEPYELWPHLGNLGFNLLAGLIVWRIADTGHALITAIPGEVIGEVQLWTTPHGPADDLKQYKVQFGPMVQPTGNEHDPAVGVMMKLGF